MYTTCLEPRTRLISIHPHRFHAASSPFRDEMDRQDEVRFFPRVNVASDEAAYRVAIELPGMKKEEISIRYAEEVLRVSGERKSEGSAKGEWLYRERLDGKFERRFRFRKPVDPTNITALYENGMLTITVPYSQEALPKRIEIK